MNPFRCGTTRGERSHLPEPVFRDFIRDADLPDTGEDGKPLETFRSWAAWWGQMSASVTPEANVILWDALFPDFRFYTVSRVLFEE